MKKLLFVLFLMVGLVFGQATVKTVPQYHGWESVYEDTAKGAAITTSAISPQQWAGAITIGIYADTVDSGTPSAFKIHSEIYCAASNMAQWLDYYVVDSVYVPASKYAADYFFVNWGNKSSNSWGDSLRFIITPASGDTALFKVVVGGQ